MLKDEYISRVALFFHFALEDEKQAIHAAERSVARLKAYIRENRTSDAQVRTAMIRICAKHHKRFLTSPPRLRLGAPVIENAFQLPKGLSLAAWARYLKLATPDEVLSFIFVGILRFEENEVAEALNLNSGTIRYRVGKSYQMLADNLSASGG